MLVVLFIVLFYLATPAQAQVGPSFPGASGQTSYVETTSSDPSAGTSCTPGQIQFSDSYLYLCVSGGTWARASYNIKESSDWVASGDYKFEGGLSFDTGAVSIDGTLSDNKSLAPGATSSTITANRTSCGNAQVLQGDGTCTDISSLGQINSVGATAPLESSGGADPTLTLLIHTNGGLASGADPSNGNKVSLTLRTNCDDGQLLGWDDNTSSWVCVDDSNTEYTAGVGLTLDSGQFKLTGCGGSDSYIYWDTSDDDWNCISTGNITAAHLAAEVDVPNLLGSGGDYNFTLNDNSGLKYSFSNAGTDNSSGLTFTSSPHNNTACPQPLFSGWDTYVGNGAWLSSGATLDNSHVVDFGSGLDGGDCPIWKTPLSSASVGEPYMAGVSQDLGYSVSYGFCDTTSGLKTCDAGPNSGQLCSDDSDCPTSTCTSNPASTPCYLKIRPIITLDKNQTKIWVKDNLPDAFVLYGTDGTSSQNALIKVQTSNDTESIEFTPDGTNGVKIDENGTLQALTNGSNELIGAVRATEFDSGISFSGFSWDGDDIPDSSIASASTWNDKIGSVTAAADQGIIVSGDLPARTLALKSCSAGQILRRGTTNNWECKNTKVFNILNYGGDCSGTNDSQSAIQGAIDAASAAGGGTVEIPSGQTCYVNGPLVLKTSVSLTCNGSTLKATGSFAEEGHDAIVVTKGGTPDITEVGGDSTLQNCRFDLSGEPVGAVSLSAPSAEQLVTLAPPKIDLVNLTVLGASTGSNDQPLIDIECVDTLEYKCKVLTGGTYLDTSNTCLVTSSDETSSCAGAGEVCPNQQWMNDNPNNKTCSNNINQPCNNSGDCSDSGVCRINRAKIDGSERGGFCPSLVNSEIFCGEAFGYSAGQGVPSVADDIGVRLHGNGTGARITGNSIHSCDSVGLVIQQSEVLVSDNSIDIDSSDDATGLFVDTTGVLKVGNDGADGNHRVNISNNSITATGVNPICIYLSGTSHLISGNTITMPYLNDTAPYSYGILSRAAQVQISGNLIEGGNYGVVAQKTINNRLNGNIIINQSMNQVMLGTGWHMVGNTLNWLANSIHSLPTATKTDKPATNIALGDTRSGYCASKTANTWATSGTACNSDWDCNTTQADGNRFGLQACLNGSDACTTDDGNACRCDSNNDGSIGAGETIECYTPEYAEANSVNYSYCSSIANNNAYCQVSRYPQYGRDSLTADDVFYAGGRGGCTTHTVISGNNVHGAFSVGVAVASPTYPVAPVSGTAAFGFASPSICKDVTITGNLFIGPARGERCHIGTNADLTGVTLSGTEEACDCTNRDVNAPFSDENGYFLADTDGGVNRYCVLSETSPDVSLGLLSEASYVEDSTFDTRIRNKNITFSGNQFASKTRIKASSGASVLAGITVSSNGGPNPYVEDTWDSLYPGVSSNANFDSIRVNSPIGKESFKNVVLPSQTVHVNTASGTTFDITTTPASDLQTDIQTGWYIVGKGLTDGPSAFKTRGAVDGQGHRITKKTPYSGGFIMFALNESDNNDDSVIPASLLSSPVGSVHTSVDHCTTNAYVGKICNLYHEGDYIDLVYDKYDTRKCYGGGDDGDSCGEADVDVFNSGSCSNGTCVEGAWKVTGLYSTRGFCSVSKGTRCGIDSDCPGTETCVSNAVDITADTLTADTLTAGTLTAGTLTADTLTADTLTADTLTVTSPIGKESFKNVVLHPQTLHVNGEGVVPDITTTPASDLYTNVAQGLQYTIWGFKTGGAVDGQGHRITKRTPYNQGKLLFALNRTDSNGDPVIPASLIGPTDGSVPNVDLCFSGNLFVSRGCYIYREGDYIDLVYDQYPSRKCIGGDNADNSCAEADVDVFNSGSCPNGTCLEGAWTVTGLYSTRGFCTTSGTESPARCSINSDCPSGETCDTSQ